MWLTPIKLRRDQGYPLWRRLFDDFFETPYTALREGNGHSLIPALDLNETDTSLIVETELPGVDPKDVTLQVEGDVLTIRGERKHQKEDPGKTTYCQECSYGVFERQVRLPMGVESEKAEATFDKGVLKVTLPKKPASRPKAMPIKVK